MKKLTFVEGDLLKHPNVQVIGHQANCQNTFGSGIARSIREMYPEAYQADTNASEVGNNKLGSFSVGVVSVNGVEMTNRYGNHIRRIYNLYGQNLGTNRSVAAFNRESDRKTNYEALYCALEGMAAQLSEYDGDHLPPVVGFPHYIGCDRGGGAWTIVERLIEVAFDGYENEVLIVKFKP